MIEGLIFGREKNWQSAALLVDFGLLGAVSRTFKTWRLIFPPLLQVCGTFQCCLNRIELSSQTLSPRGPWLSHTTSAG